MQVNQCSNIKNEIISYTSDCNARGISKNNNSLIEEIEGKISRLKIAVEVSEDVTNRSSSNYSSASNSYSSLKICSWCGKSFSGNGFNYIMGQCISASGDFYTKCSMKCCNEARRSDPNLSDKWKH